MSEVNKGVRLESTHPASNDFSIPQWSGFYIILSGWGWIQYLHILYSLVQYANHVNIGVTELCSYILYIDIHVHVYSSVIFTDFVRTNLLFVWMNVLFARTVYLFVRTNERTTLSFVWTNLLFNLLIRPNESLICSLICSNNLQIPPN